MPDWTDKAEFRSGINYLVQNKNSCLLYVSSKICQLKNNP